MRYYGIGDAHGLESFLCAKDIKNTFHQERFLQLRASLNRQRHACFYELDINPFEAKLVQKLLDNNMFKSALQVVKAFPQVKVLGSYEDSWKKIPDSALDPWYASAEENEADDPKKLNLEEYILQNN